MGASAAAQALRLCTSAGGADVKSEDIRAMEELALDMTWREAAYFIRDTTGCTLMTAINKAKWLASTHPKTPIADSLSHSQPEGTHQDNRP